MWNRRVTGVWAVLVVALVPKGLAQDTLRATADTQTREKGACCLRTVTIAGGVGAAGSLVLLDQAWYAQYDRTPFHWFNDGEEWFLMDKTGHFFSSYALGGLGHAALAHCGASERKARWLGGSIGLIYLTGIEVLDGTSSGWGFSNWDMAANIAGAGLFIGQDVGWGEQRIRPKLSTHPTDYATMRPDLLGENLPQQVLKDYNGLTLWMSGNVSSLSGSKTVPAWLNIAVGYGAEGMVSADPRESAAVTGMQPYRQFYLSPDIDLTKLKCRSKLGRTLLFLLNNIKIPAPALEIRSTGRVVGHWLYF